MDDKRAAVSSPCLGCERRFVGCHSVCDEYTHYHSARNKMLEEKRRAIDGNAMTSSLTSRWLKRLSGLKRGAIKGKDCF
jgi:hypothetical protein